MLTKVLSCFSRVRLFVTPWTVSRQAPLSMELSRQEYWSGLPFPCPGDLPHPGTEPMSPALQADSLPSEPSGKPTYSLKGHRRTSLGPVIETWCFHHKGWGFIPGQGTKIPKPHEAAKTNKQTKSSGHRDFTKASLNSCKTKPENP